jgi:hypothetical protein
MRRTTKKRKSTKLLKRTAKKRRTIRLDGRRNNGHDSQWKENQKARARVLKVAKRQGVISNADAKEIGGWDQAWYHLQAMVKAGQLRKRGYNQWIPTSR